MDKLTSIHLTFDKVLITILIPGIVASYPYLMIIFQEFEGIKDYFDSTNLTAFVAFLTIVSLAMGMILENIGGRIEVHIYDKIHVNQSCGERFDETWKEFLTLSYPEKEPVGHRYLRDILMRMKFELAFGLAVFIMSIGLLVYDSKFVLIEDCCTSLFVLGVIPMLLSTYLLVIEGYSSSKILCNTRKLLVEKFPHALGGNHLSKSAPEKDDNLDS